MNALKKNEEKTCELCHREAELTFHHLIPKTLHKKKWYKKNYSLEELQNGIYVCTSCHKAIHDFISEKKLGAKYNTKQLLLQHPDIKKFIAWISKQNRHFASVRSKFR